MRVTASIGTPEAEAAAAGGHLARLGRRIAFENLEALLEQRPGVLVSGSSTA